MMDYRQMPSRVDWCKLIRLLRQSYRRGDGGLAEASGIDKQVLSDGSRRGVHSWQNGVTLWNLAVERLSVEDMESCVIHDPERLAV